MYPVLWFACYQSTRNMETHLATLCPSLQNRLYVIKPELVHRYQ
jgi:hypothetical protein